MKEKKYIIFDLDGTLLDTSSGLMKGIDFVATAFRLNALSETEKKSFIGPPIETGLREKYGLSGERLREAAALFRKVYEEQFLFDATPYPKMEECLLQLRKQGRRLSVATNKRESYAQPLMQRFNIVELCDFTRGSLDNSETKEALIELCLQALQCENRAEAVYIGDTLHDRTSAESCGIDFVGVTFGFGFSSRKTIMNTGAIAAASSFSDLLRIFTP